MAQESTSDLCVDDFYFSAVILSTEKQDDHQLTQTTENPDDQTFAVSDAKYAEELQFQEAIMASLNSSQNPNTPPAIQDNPSMPNPQPIAKEVGESSQSFCEICAERKENEEFFRVDKCSHSFCSDCITKHVATKISDNINIVHCPGLDCEGVIEVDPCRSMIPKDVLVRWDEVLCESLISASQKFYCPFKDCSAMLVNDGVEVVRESECPICRRLFCAQCYVPWHSGIGCEEFQRLNVDERGREDLMVRELAKEKNWKRCPQCKFYVEKIEGCLHMTCSIQNDLACDTSDQGSALSVCISVLLCVWSKLEPNSWWLPVTMIAAVEILCLGRCYI